MQPSTTTTVYHPPSDQASFTLRFSRRMCLSGSGIWVMRVGRGAGWGNAAIHYFGLPFPVDIALFIPPIQGKCILRTVVLGDADWTRTLVRSWLRLVCQYPMGILPLSNLQLF